VDVSIQVLTKAELPFGSQASVW